MQRLLGMQPKISSWEVPVQVRVCLMFSVLKRFRCEVHFSSFAHTVTIVFQFREWNAAFLANQGIGAPLRVVVSQLGAHPTQSLLRGWKTEEGRSEVHLGRTIERAEHEMFRGRWEDEMFRVKQAIALKSIWSILEFLFKSCSFLSVES